MLVGTHAVMLDRGAISLLITVCEVLHFRKDLRAALQL